MSSHPVLNFDGIVVGNVNNLSEIKNISSVSALRTVPDNIRVSLHSRCRFPVVNFSPEKRYKKVAQAEVVFGNRRSVSAAVIEFQSTDLEHCYGLVPSDFASPV
jgi:hypothetical protein